MGAPVLFFEERDLTFQRARRLLRAGRMPFGAQASRRYQACGGLPSRRPNLLQKPPQSQRIARRLTEPRARIDLREFLHYRRQS
jgi:hypothetical protein